MTRPILAVDIDGVISLFGAEEQPDRSFTKLELVDGVPHLISLPVGDRLLRLSEHFELVWASGWEDKANFYLPTLLGLPGASPRELSTAPCAPGPAHWKLGPLDEYAVGPSAGLDRRQLRPELLRVGGASASEPTLLVPTESHLGLEEAHVEALRQWAVSLH